MASRATALLLPLALLLREFATLGEGGGAGGGRGARAQPGCLPPQTPPRPARRASFGCRRPRCASL